MLQERRVTNLPLVLNTQNISNSLHETKMASHQDDRSK